MSTKREELSEVAEEQYVLGIDFGTLSGRALVVRTSDGAELGTAVASYSNGVMDDELTAADGQKLPAEFALQDPNDYRMATEEAVRGAVQDAGIDPAKVVGIGIDFTSATVLACKNDGTPLCEIDEYRNNPHAWVKLWKHHGGVAEANRIVEVARERGEDWLGRYGGILNSEMGLPKALETFNKAPEIYEATDVFCNALDWIIWWLTGELQYSAANAGYKFNWQDGTYPSEDFLREVAPGFEGVFKEKLTAPIIPLGARAGGLTEEMAERLGLRPGIAVATGNIDAHVAAAAVQGLEPGQLTAIMGTSNCYVISDEQLVEVPGVFGVVDGGIIDGLWGYEAGQSAVGDIFAWFIDTCVPASYFEEAERRGIDIHELLSELGAQQAVGEHGLVGLDWHNGNRSVLSDASLTGLLVGQTLATKPEDQYRALVESTAFGARTIIESFRSAGIAVNELIACGGVTKNRWIMQLYCDICRVPLSVGETVQTGSLGSAVFAAVAAGVYPDARAASQAMGAKTPNAYSVDEERAAKYDELFAIYQQLHDYFGREHKDVMHKLRGMRRQARS